jgi:hypothetical protein
MGTATGLTALNPDGGLEQLWKEGAVRKILRTPSEWFILSDQGIFASKDLTLWEARNTGLPQRVLKLYGDGKKSFLSLTGGIKDLEADPENPDTLVCAVKDGVYLSRNGGRDWENLGAPPFRSNGIKAVGVSSLPGAGGTRELTVFCSHGIYGMFYLNPDKPGAKWTELAGGLEKLETTGNPDEVSDIAVITADGAPPLVCVSQSFRPRLYRLDWAERRFSPLWSGEGDFGSLDSLSPGREALRFLEDGRVMELPYPLNSGPPEKGPPAGEGGDGEAAAGTMPRRRTDLEEFIGGIPRNLNIKLHCLVLCEDINNPASELLSLSELWMLEDPPPAEEPDPRGREGLYLPVNHALSRASLQPYLELIEKRNLNMIVIDMKDDYGRLRFTPRNRELAAWGRVSRPLDIDPFLREMKDRGVYTVARVVVFKDPEAAKREGGKYAVWDGGEQAPWVGYRTGASGEKEYYDERWVDPYSEAVWDYVASLSVELHERGFDEIQFDYIRFPTDGINLAAARYRFRDPNMDMDSAIISFLLHVRSRLKAPLSVDIYGANGWYRTGARTGQEVELLAPLVDVICPMYYPSHFEQDFLAQDPPELRPYRIYYQGTRRTRIMARNEAIVRPYVQAFYLNVSYDRKYYTPDYVRRQTEGARDAGSGGLTYWNNSGRYDDIPQSGDPGAD